MASLAELTQREPLPTLLDPPARTPPKPTAEELSTPNPMGPRPSLDVLGNPPNARPDPRPNSLICGGSARVKVAGAVVTLHWEGGCDVRQVIEEIRSQYDQVEFETELSKQFGPRGELKRGALMTVSIKAKGEKATITATGALDGTGELVEAIAWCDDQAKARELLGPLGLVGDQAANAEAALTGKIDAVLLAQGCEFSFRESERDGKKLRRLVEFHQGQTQQAGG